ncbi:class I SAM-dependent methyltransferase [Lysinibacillus sp. BW-2-10]|uniref:class I SAM-dependent methyltransferase n=1 Tax=Lysinibacillus sp. BW-2-10 TaxID=2590030 RepID=UPI00117EC7CD|nr:class I SAM-dependent methyltransferase [Lysinibacillus sp. BW-2-10]TSI09108.1 class I SAM-dependent methyltransferase [Lysinibacillus sp. BW-2-10]
MKTNEASVTSLMTAFGRAYHTLYDTPKIFEDTIVKDLITDDEFSDISRNLINGVSFINKEIAAKFQHQPEEILKWFTQIQLAPTTLSRSAFCESVLLNELALGVEQYVILGAGFDTFGFRHPELNETLEIYEIDHPATQQFKKDRLAQANYQIPNNLHFISMDFTKGFDIQKLIDQGFSLNKKTFFSLLGVSYYLTKEEIATLLSELFSFVPYGSSIVMDYGDATLFEETGVYNRVQNMIQMAAFNGEPMKSCFTYKGLEKMLEDSGLLLYKHLTPATINERFFQNRSDYLSAFETIHFIHAVKKE